MNITLIIQFFIAFCFGALTENRIATYRLRKKIFSGESVGHPLLTQEEADELIKTIEGCVKQNGN